MGLLAHLITLSLLLCIQQTVGLFSPRVSLPESTSVQWELIIDTEPLQSTISLTCRDVLVNDLDINHDMNFWLNRTSSTFDSVSNIDVRVESERFGVPHDLTSTVSFQTIRRHVPDPPISQGINLKIILILYTDKFLLVSISWAADRNLECSNIGLYDISKRSGINGIQRQQYQSDDGGRDCSEKQLSSNLQNSRHRLRLKSNCLQVECKCVLEFVYAVLNTAAATHEFYPLQPSHSCMHSKL